MKSKVRVLHAASRTRKLLPRGAGLAVLTTAALAVIAAGCRVEKRPEKPEVFGPATSQPGETLSFRATARDANHDNLSFRFDWGDGSEQVWTPQVGSGETVSQRHTYGGSGTYEMRAVCRDETGLESGSSAQVEIDVSFLGPETPLVPSGPAQAFRDTAVVFTTSAGHVRAESVALQFDWGDGTPDTGFTGFAPVGAPVCDSHSYEGSGTYLVRARARDRTGNLSPWSGTSALTVVLRPLLSPYGLSLAAQSGVQVRVAWRTAGGQDSVEYALWFRSLDDSQFTKVGEATRLFLVHDPLGATGWYTVSASREAEEVFSSETVSTVPVFTDTLILSELNTAGPAGLGWDTVSGLAGPGSMRDTMQAWFLDEYYTDLTPGSAGPSYYLASAGFGPEDPGGIVPPGPWRGTRLMGLLGSIQDPLPEFDSLLYQRVVDVTAFRSNVAVHTPEGFYGLISCFGPNQMQGTIPAVAWFQKVKGLRLIRHEEQPGSP
jgi:hypothetical protein